MSIERIGVIGAGQMGRGIAHVLSLAGYGVVLEDIDAGILADAVSDIRKSMKRQVAKGIVREEAVEPALARIEAVNALTPVAMCDAVIETATEDEAVKCEILRELCPLLPKETIIATNTSSISITRLASSTDRPERFIGIHFMKPAPIMKLVEVIRGIATDDSTFQIALEIVRRCGKTPSHAEDFPAFIVNRILLPMINEAVYTLYEGVGNVEAIDTAMRLGANHPMGPLQLADFLGLDTCLSVMQVLYEGLADSKYRPCPLLVKYVEAGWLGRKTGRGFYDYRGDHPVPTR
jgi:3-hydroxybutyryl-CoA dehydrogenase